MTDTWAGDSARTTPQGAKFPNGADIYTEWEHVYAALPSTSGAVEGVGAGVELGTSMVKGTKGFRHGGEQMSSHVAAVAAPRMYRTTTNVAPISPVVTGQAANEPSNPNKPSEAMSPDVESTPWAPAARRRNTQLLDLLGLGTQEQPSRSGLSYNAAPAIHVGGDVAPQRGGPANSAAALEVLEVLDVRALCEDMAVMAQPVARASQEAGRLATCTFVQLPSSGSFQAGADRNSASFIPYVPTGQPHSPLLSPRPKFNGVQQRAMAMTESVVDVVHLSAGQRGVGAHAHCGELPPSLQRSMAGSGGGGSGTGVGRAHENNRLLGTTSINDLYGNVALYDVHAAQQRRKRAP